MTTLPQLPNDGTREVLVGKDPHRPKRLRDGVDPLRTQGLAGICQAGLDIFGSEMVVLPKDVLLGIPPRQKVDDQLHGDSGALDHRLSHQNVRSRYWACRFSPL